MSMWSFRGPHIYIDSPIQAEHNFKKKPNSGLWTPTKRATGTPIYGNSHMGLFRSSGRRAPFPNAELCEVAWDLPSHAVTQPALEGTHTFGGVP